MNVVNNKLTVAQIILNSVTEQQINRKDLQDALQADSQALDSMLAGRVRFDLFRLEDLCELLDLDTGPVVRSFLLEYLPDQFDSPDIIAVALLVEKDRMVDRTYFGSNITGPEDIFVSAKATFQRY